MSVQLMDLINACNFDALRRALADDPELANTEIPFDDNNKTTAHPLHRICDGVFYKKYSDEDAVRMARIFLDAGARVNGNSLVVRIDSPLVAAASLYADKVAILYIDEGAEINHPGCNGGTALHWASLCGRPLVVEKLLQANADREQKCLEYQGTPIQWCRHGMQEAAKEKIPDYLECMKKLQK